MEEKNHTEINNLNDVITNYGFRGGFLGVAQHIGKSLSYPIAILPIAAFLLRFGILFENLGISYDDQGLQEITIPALYWLGFILKTPGEIVFYNLPLIFAIGISFGFAHDRRGEAALTGAVAYLVLFGLVQMEGSLSTMFYGNSFLVQSSYDGQYYSKLLYIVPQNGGEPIWLLNLGVFGGIEAGLISAYLYNRFYKTELPPALGFFSGRRFVPIVVVLVMIIIAIPTAALWPWLQYGLLELSMLLIKIPWLGAGFYVFFNRLLVIFGFQHVLNIFFWFQMPITVDGQQIFYMSANGTIMPLTGDMTAYLSAGSLVNNGIMVGSSGQLIYGQEAWNTLADAHIGAYQVGLFPIVMSATPAVALAIILSSEKKNRSSVVKIMTAAAFISFFGGITEPVEYSFMFVSPLLYFCYSALSGVVSSAVVASGISFGFGTSIGILDLITSAPVAINISTGGWYSYLILLGFMIIIFPIFFAMSYFIIIKTDAPTIGRNGNYFEYKKNSDQNDKNQELYRQMAKDTIELLGGIEKIKEVDNCITRVRLIVEDNSNIKQEDVKKIGYLGYSRVGKNSAQFIPISHAGLISEYILQAKNEARLIKKVDNKFEENLNNYNL